MNKILSTFVGAERKIHMKLIIHLYLVLDICCFRRLMDVNIFFVGPSIHLHNPKKFLLMLNNFILVIFKDHNFTYM